MGQFLLSKTFWKNIGLSIILLGLIMVGTNKWLEYFTLHNETVAVPDYSGIPFDELDNFNYAYGFRFILNDSVFDNTQPRGSVVEQDPAAGKEVKPGRKIYLTIVAKQPEKVAMPNLIDFSLRQALATLETYGLNINRLDYIPDIARNAVLKQHINGTEITPGTMIEKGSLIDLTLGMGLSDEKVALPFLLGLHPQEARALILHTSLNIGAEIIEVEADSSDLRVYRQNPQWTENSAKPIGSTVDLWYRSSAEVDFQNLLSQYHLDSLAIDSIMFKTDSLFINDTLPTTDSLHINILSDTLIY